MALVKDTIQPDDWHDIKIAPFTSVRLDDDPDNIQNHELTRAENLRFFNNTLKPPVDYAAYHTTALTGTPMAVYKFEGITGIRTTFLFTTSNVYYDDGTDWQSIYSSLTGSVEDYFSVVGIPWGDQVVFTNGVDTVKVIDGQTNTVSDLTGPVANTICKSVAVYNSCLWLFNLNENSSAYPQRVRGSDQADITEWVAGVAYVNDLFESTSPIIVGVQMGPYLIVYRERGIHRIALSNNPTKTYDVDQMVPDQGVYSIGSVVQIDKNEHVIWGTDNLYKYNGGFGVEQIGEKIRDQIFGPLSTEEPSQKHKRQFLYLEDLEELTAVYVPTDGTYPTYAVVGDLSKDSWTTRIFTHSVRGYSKIATTVSIGWDDLVGTWAAQTQAWNDFVTDVGNLLLIFASDTRTYSLAVDETGDNGTVTNKIVETKDFSEYPFHGRLDWIDLRCSGGGVTVQYSIDEGATWTTLAYFIAADEATVYRIHKQIVYESIRFRFQSASLSFALYSMSLRVCPEDEIVEAPTLIGYPTTESLNVLLAVNTQTSLGRIMKSTDGVNFSEIDHAIGVLGSLGAIGYSAEQDRWVAVTANATTDDTWYSDDSGETWTQGEDIPQGTELEFCVYSDIAERWFIGRDDSSNNLLESTTGEGPWTLNAGWTSANRTHAYAESALRNIIVVVGIMTGRIFWSEDGDTWTIATHTVDQRPLTILRIEEIDLFIMVELDASTGYVHTSNDGKTWTEQANTLPVNSSGSDEFCRLAYCPTNGVIVYAAEDHGIYYSADRGLTWTLSYNDGARPNDIAWFDEASRFVAVCDSGVILTSPTGLPETWSTLAAPAADTYQRIAIGA
jgi:hypothetical protein